MSSMSTLADQLREVLPESRRADITGRWQRAETTLLPLLEKLYATAFADRRAFYDWVQVLVTQIAQAAAVRSPELYELDLQRQHQPDWFLSAAATGYCAYADRFAGSLRGVADKIPHLQELGVSYLHLLPFLKAREGENDGGFAVSDFEQVAPQLGDLSDLHALTAALRKAGISLCSDLVLNHVADDHRWAQAARAGDSRYRDYFYCLSDEQQVAGWEAGLGQIFPQAAPGNFTYVADMGGWVWTTFYPYQWDLNYRNPQVFLEMVRVLLTLANHGIEAFRLDSTAFLWKRPGTNCMNQPEAHWILQAFRQIMDIAAPGVLLKAEAIVQTAQLPAYLGDSENGIPECHLAYHSSLMAASWLTLAEQDTSLLRDVIGDTPALPGHASWLTYVRCHDDIGWNVLRPEARMRGAHEAEVQQRLAAVSRFYSGEGDSFADGRSFQADDPQAVHGSVGMAAALCGWSAGQGDDQQWQALDRLLLMYGFSFCFGGMPLIYMGDEYAALNDESYLHDDRISMDSRWLHRPHWDRAAFEASCRSDTPQGGYAQSLRGMLRLRASLPMLNAAAERQLLALSDTALLAVARCHAGQRFVFLANFSATARTLNLDELNACAGQAAEWRDLLAHSQTSPALPATLTLNAWQQCWLVPLHQEKYQEERYEP